VKRWETKSLDVARGQTDGEDWLAGMDCLGEDVGAKRQAADVFEHVDDEGGRDYLGPRGAGNVLGS